jgi:hypothetical protein
LKKRLQSEGHSIVRRGKIFFVEDFQQSLFVPLASPDAGT